MVKSVYMCAVCLCRVKWTVRECVSFICVTIQNLWRVRMLILNGILDTLLQWIPVTRTRVIDCVSMLLFLRAGVSTL